MEVAASGIAVASIAIQLLTFTNTIRTFIRNVKDAPHELLRVVNLLERLSGLFQVVADLLEQQSSLQDGLFPIPDTICTCIRSCKENLAPLQEIVDRFSKFQTSSRLRRLPTDVKTALKAGDLRSLENRLQHEINGLSIALIANDTRIL
jgi:hypothetical protein